MPRQRSCLFIRNDGDDPLFLSSGMRLGSIKEAQIEGAFHVSPEDHGLAALTPYPDCPDPEKETKLTNGITIYGNQNAANALAAVTETYPRLWVDKGTTVKIPAEDFLPVPLNDGWEKGTLSTRPYPLSAQDRAVVNTTFDKLHADGKMTWTDKPTPFGFPVFVVWKGTKGRAVVDIRGLNKVSAKDSYPVPLQADILSAIRGAKYITTIDAVSFFYQWLIHQPDRHKFTVNSFRGQEQLQVALMGYCNSVQHVQRQLDRILRRFREFCRAYVDDIVIWSDTLDDHIEHLHQVFKALDELDVSLSPAKSFLGYPTATVLGQRVNGFGLTAHEDKIRAILDIKFPSTLHQLEHYLGLTGWLRQHIPYYAQITEPLHARKIALLKPAPQKKGPRRRFANKTPLGDDLERALAAFDLLQSMFRNSAFLWHFNPDRKLYVDIDASKEFGFAAAVYMVKDDPDPITMDGKNHPFPATAVQVIMFLSKGLTATEKRYFATELEMAGLVWLLRKIRHLVQATSAPTTIFTDHAAAVNLALAHSLTTTSATDKLNLRLVRASGYIQTYRLALLHRAGRLHGVPADALSRLVGNTEAPTAQPEHDTLDPLAYEDPEQNTAMCFTASAMSDQAVCFNATLVEMSEDFKTRLLQAYAEDPLWKNRLDQLHMHESRRVASRSAGTQPDDGHDSDPEHDEPESHPLGLRFFLRRGLIYFRDQEDGRERLCIPSPLYTEVFRMAHDDHHHAGLHRALARIQASFYIRHLTQNLRIYIRHCPQCMQNQTLRTKPIGELCPIDTRPIPFHTQTADWVHALPPTSTGLDTVLTVTCRFSKKILLVAGRGDWSAKEWAVRWLTALLGHDWSIPAILIGDRDPLWFSEFWQAVFEKLNTRFLASTAYHPQTDGQSERTNQTMEIALRFFVQSNPDAEWTDALPHLQATLNNSKNASTNVEPNAVVMGFKTNLDALDPLVNLPPADFAAVRAQLRTEAADALGWAAATMKQRYDTTRRPITLHPGDKVMLKLHKGYQIPGNLGPKLGKQRVGPFTIERMVGRLACRLKLPPTWRIHPVVSVAQLEPAPNDPDPHGRENPEPPPLSTDLDDPAPVYEIESLLARRRSRGKTQYLVKWAGYGHEHNVWYNAEDLTSAQELMRQYDETHPDNTNPRIRRGRR